MRVLAFDTTSSSGSVALCEDGDIVDELTLHSPDGFSHVLFDAVGALLAKHGWSVSSVDAFAAASGPGSFTGVRVSLAAAKGLAEASSKPVYGVSNLQAGASLGSASIRAPWIDARRGEVYGGVYSATLEPLEEERVLPFDRWKEHLPSGAELIECDRKPLAAAIARIAYERLARGDTGLPETLDANYVRRSDAELFWKDPPTS